MLKRVVWAAGCLALAVGFAAMIVWSLRSGTAAGKFGAAARAEWPGIYWFLLTAHALMSLGFLAQAVKAFAPKLPLRPLVLPALALFLLMGVWMGVECGRMLVRSILSVPDTNSRLVMGGMAVAGVGVLGFVLYQLVWLDLRDRWRRREPAK